MMLKKMLSVALAGTFALALAGCGGDSKAPAKKPEPKELTIYYGTVEQQAKLLSSEFEKDTGIKVKYVRMSGGEILSRIRAEKNKPQASLWYGGSADSYIVAQKEGLLTPYQSAATNKIPANFKDKDGHWVGVYQGYLSFVCDTKAFEEMKKPLPETWDDLLKPELKGKIIMSNPGTASTGYVIVSTLAQLKGEKAAMEYFGKLHPQIKTYTKSGAAPARSAGLGECAVGLTYHQVGLRLQKDYKNIKVVIPKDGTGYEVGAAAIIKGGADEEAAKRFIDWAVSKKAQELCQKIGSYQLLTNPEAEPLPEAKQFKDAKIINYDFAWSGANRKRLVEEWNKTVKK